MILVLGVVPMLACLALQALVTVFAARYFGRAMRQRDGRRSRRWVFTQFSVLMLILMLGIVIQIIVWALLYRLLGAFEDLETAMYFSGVTFTTLGYGDALLTGRMRLLGPLQAANGVMMFGITTAVFMAAVQHAIANWSRERPSHPDGG